MECENQGVDPALFALLCERFRQAGFYQLHEVALRTVGPGKVSIIAVTSPKHRETEEQSYAGLYLTMADAAMGNAAGAMGLMSAVTTSLSVNYLKSVPEGTTVMAYGRIDQVEGHEVFASAEVYAEDALLMNCIAVFYQA